jgi:mRNA interferase MazF
MQNTVISRGEVFYITSILNQPEVGSEQKSGRPAVVVSNNLNNKNSTVVEICYMTLQKKIALPTHVSVKSGPCINSTILCEQVTSVSVDRLGDYMCRLPDEVMDKVDEAIVESLGLQHIVERLSSKNQTVVEKIVEVAKPVGDPSHLQEENVRLKIELESVRNMYDRLLDRFIKKGD